MKPVLCLTLLAAAALAGAGTGNAAQPASPSVAAAPAATPSASDSTATSCPKPSATMQKILVAMNAADTYGHPDLFGEYAGMERYYACRFSSAMKYFKIGANFADKLSQLTIGLMYLKGQGVAKNPATACAWLELAAERKYPEYVAASNAVCGALSPAEQQQSKATLASLLPEYGDKVAMRRMVTKLHVTKATMYTGSRVGFDFGQSAASGKLGSMGAFSYGNLSGGCGAPAMQYGGIPVPVKHCSMVSLWSPWYWTPKIYFAVRNGTYGHVSVGKLTEIVHGLEHGKKSTGNHTPTPSTDDTSHP